MCIFESQSSRNETASSGGRTTKDDWRYRLAERYDLVTRSHEQLCEVAIYTAMVMSVINSCSNKPLSPKAFSKLLPWTPSRLPTLRAVALTHRNALDNRASAKALFDLMTGFQEANHHIKQMAASCAPDRPITAVEVKVIKASWFDVTRQLLICHFELSSFVDDAAPFSKTQKNNMIVDLMLDVRQGGVPCLKENGIAYPVWLRRRASARAPRNVAAQIQKGARRYSGVVLDQSVGGCNIYCNGFFCAGDRITIVECNGTTRQGRVVRGRSFFWGIAYTDTSGAKPVTNFG